MPFLDGHKSLNSQETTARSRNVEVEKVETVEIVELVGAGYTFVVPAAERTLAQTKSPTEVGIESGQQNRTTLLSSLLILFASKPLLKDFTQSSGCPFLRATDWPHARTRHGLFLRSIRGEFLKHLLDALVEVVDVLFGLIGKRVTGRAAPH